MQSTPAKLRAKRARDIYGLVEVLENVAERIIDDFSPSLKQWDEARWEASQKKRKLAAEKRKNAAWLGCSAGDLTDTLAGILKPGSDDPSAFVEKGVVKDPVEFTQAELNKCVLFGLNGVLNNADMCHHLLMMLVPRCSAPPNPDPGSPLRGSLIHEIAIAFPRSLGTFGECADRGSPLRGSPIYEIAIPVPRSLGTFGEGGVVAGGAGPG